MRVPFFTTVFAFSVLSLLAADGEDSFQTRCVLCHGGDGAGTDRAQSILPTIHAGPVASWVVPDLLFEELSLTRPRGEVRRLPVLEHPSVDR